MFYERIPSVQHNYTKGNLQQEIIFIFANVRQTECNKNPDPKSILITRIRVLQLSAHL